VDDYSSREAQPALGSPATSLRAFVGEVGLAEHDICGTVARSRRAMPYEDPVIAGIGNYEALGIEPYPSGSVQVICPGNSRR
jgi:hypothetical protein